MFFLWQCQCQCQCQVQVHRNAGVRVTSRCFVSGVRTEITEYLQLPELSFLAAPDGVVQCPSSALRVSVHGLGLLFSSNDRDRCERIIQVSTSSLLFPIFLGYFPLRQTSPQ